MDSLTCSGRSSVVKILQEYLQEEWKVKMGSEQSFGNRVMDGWSPLVPKQDNYTDFYRPTTNFPSQHGPEWLVFTEGSEEEEEANQTAHSQTSQTAKSLIFSGHTLPTDNLMLPQPTTTLPSGFFF